MLCQLLQVYQSSFWDGAIFTLDPLIFFIVLYPQVVLFFFFLFNISSLFSFLFLFVTILWFSVFILVPQSVLPVADILFFSPMALEFELRNSHMLGRRSIT
jgi:hypothetical protein